MNKEELFKQAIKLLRKREYEKSVKLLEPKVPLFAGDGEFFYLVGSACYFNGDNKGAEIYLSKGLSCLEDSIEMRLMLSATMLKKRDTATSIRLWLEVLEIDPDNKRARFGLDAMKELNTSSELARFVRSNAMNYLVVPFKRMPSSKVLFMLTFTFIMLLITTLFVIFTALNPRYIYNFTRQFRSNIYAQYKPLKENEYVSDAGVFYKKYSLDEVNQIMANAADYIFLGKNNLAQVEYNKIKNSNAPVVLKEKALKWESLLENPTFDNIKDVFTFKEVSSEPYLYENCFVNWTGAISDINIDKQYISFNLMVGYQNKQVLDGQIKVFLDFEVALDQSLTTEVLGQVKIDEKGRFYLKGISIYQKLH